MVGGKVANLSRLAAAHRIPPGFCVTTLAFTRGMATGPLPGQTHLSSLSIPSDLLEQLADAYRRLEHLCQTPKVSVAVRSSDTIGMLTAILGDASIACVEDGEMLTSR